MTRRLGCALVALCAALLTAAAPAPAEENIWTDLLSAAPGVVPQPNSTGFNPASHDICLSGDIRCVESVARQMTRRLDPLARSCQHSAMFSLAYLRVTDSELAEPVAFSDRAFINHEVWVFAGYYFAAFDAWKTGASVAPAWKVAFDAARDRTVPSGTDLTLGFVAHIQRDLPFVLYRMGLTAPDGTSRKGDHDRVNQFLYPVTIPMLTEMARRFDPTILEQEDIVDGVWLDNDLLIEVILSWREQAWRDAEALAAAPGAVARGLVAQGIETRAYANASAYKQAGALQLSRYPTAPRDAYCAVHWND
jgi:hypothetical protein